MMTKSMIVHGMNNHHDATRVSEALKEVWGIGEVEIFLPRQEAVFSFDETAASFHDFREAVLQIGFEVTTAEGTATESLNDQIVEEKAGESLDANDM